jgi:hypothetical protein
MWSGAPVLASQIMIRRLASAVAKYFPSGEEAEAAGFPM